MSAEKLKEESTNKEVQDDWESTDGYFADANSDTQEEPGEDFDKKKSNRSRSRSHEKHPRSHFYCCIKCKRREGKKSCVCVVPRSQRRVSLGGTGCKTCSCKGCTLEDLEFDKRRKQVEDRNRKIDDDFEMRNGCCRLCMKAFAKGGKACLCQVPETVRKHRLPAEGCKICGCKGCNPEDLKSYSSPERKPSFEQNKRRDKSPKNDNDDEDDDPSSYQNLDNMNKNMILHIISTLLQQPYCLIGVGVPQRTYSYILGKPKE